MMTQSLPHDVPGVPATDSASGGKAKILIIEDDRDLNNLLKFTLESTKDYTVFSHFEGSHAFDLVNEYEPDLVILDVMLPGAYGTEVLKKIRQSTRTQHTPVILLTARSHENDKVEGFESGADDYITKPFSPKELLLRVHALLRRSSPVKMAETTSAMGRERAISVGCLKIFPEQFKVVVESETVSLTATEYQLLVYLAERAGRLQSRESLLQRVWGYEGNVNTRTVDTHIKRLRQKLGAAGHMIETVHGFGYQLVEKVENAPGRASKGKPDDDLPMGDS